MTYPVIKLRIFSKEGKRLLSYRTNYKQRLLGRLNRYSGGRNVVYKLKVEYSPGFHNEGWYDTKKDAIFAYKCFTELDLIRSFR